MKIVRLILMATVICVTVFWITWRKAPEQAGLVLYGNVDQRQVELAFLDSDRIAEVLVEEGAHVKEGQILARLETRRLRDRIAVLETQVTEAESVLARLLNGTRPEEKKQARAAVDVAKAELDYAEKRYKRLTGIARDSHGKGVRESELDEAVSKLNAARAKLILEENALRLAELGPRFEDIDQARAVLATRTNALTQLKNQLQDAELKSPADSVVNRRLLEVGDMATPQRAVFSLVVLSPKWVRAYVCEKELSSIHQGMQASITSDSVLTPLTGKVGFISSVAEFTPKTVETTELRSALVYEVRLFVTDPNDQLRLGMPVTVTFADAPSR